MDSWRLMVAHWSCPVDQILRERQKTEECHVGSGVGLRFKGQARTGSGKDAR